MPQYQEWPKTPHIEFQRENGKWFCTLRYRTQWFTEGGDTLIEAAEAVDETLENTSSATVGAADLKVMLTFMEEAIDGLKNPDDLDRRELDHLLDKLCR